MTNEQVTLRQVTEFAAKYNMDMRENGFHLARGWYIPHEDLRRLVGDFHRQLADLDRLLVKVCTTWGAEHIPTALMRELAERHDQ